MSYVLTLAIASFGLALLSCYGHHRHLHSFPTRRSSDLGGELADLRQPLDQLLVGIGQQPRHRDPAGPQLIGAHPRGVQQVGGGPCPARAGRRRHAPGRCGATLGAGGRAPAPPSAQEPCQRAHQAVPAFGAGNSPSGLPLPSQLSRLMRVPSGLGTGDSCLLVAYPGPDIPSDSSGSDIPMPGPPGAFRGQSVPVPSRSWADSACPAGITYRSSYLAIASSRYMSSISWPLIPTAWAMPSRAGLPRLMSRM